MTADDIVQLPTLAELLDFEEAHPGIGDGKATLIRKHLGINAIRYYSLLFRVINTPEAEQHNPMLVHRLLEQRERRAAERAARHYRVHHTQGDPR